jgi:hypothetical protein
MQTIHVGVMDMANVQIKLCGLRSGIYGMSITEILLMKTAQTAA